MSRALTPRLGLVARGPDERAKRCLESSERHSSTELLSFVESTSVLVPAPLRRGDLIRVVAPSECLAPINQTDVERASTDRAIRQFESLGLRVSFGQHIDAVEECRTASIPKRVEDLHDAFRDPGVRGIFTVIGGAHANQLLEALDFDLIAANPKIFCGYSDISVLQNAMLSRAGLLSYSGPHFSTLGMKHGIDFTLDSMRKALFSVGEYEIEPSTEWSDDAWFLDQEARTFVPNSAPMVLQEGGGQGAAVGGSISSFCLLNGTGFQPGLEGAVLFVEAVGGIREFDRQLQSILHQPGGDRLSAVVIGRFRPGYEVTRKQLAWSVGGKSALKGVPVIAGVDFGHTTPHATFPIGGEVRVEAQRGQRPRVLVLGRER